ncbi:MAG: hypothetical protein QOD77_2040 [Thermoplasmata archaeon]|nr:hypothetical protein [Thermoplasmata archaeon]
MTAGLHVLGASERGLTVRAADGAVSALGLEGAFGWRLSGERRCVGQWRDGAHVPCPTEAVVSEESTCLPCSGLEAPDCVYEPRCQNAPETCRCPFGPVPHVVYAAFYGILPKVGLTQAWRVGTRLREQGADAYFVVADRPDRATARLLERQVAFLYGIPESRAPREVLPQLVRPVAWAEVEARAAALRARLAERFGPSGATVRIEDHPVRQPLPSQPRRVQPFGAHAGTWLGCKGQNLFYQEAPRPDRLMVGAAPVAALKRSDLPGRTLTHA